MTSPKDSQRFTESYILGLGGTAANYPDEVTIGETVSVIVGIVNREDKVMRYWLEVWIDGIKNNQVGNIVLDHTKKWEHEVSFIPYKVGQNQKVEFKLYVVGRAEPVLDPLYLWISVTE